ncbi:TORTIFOLIA1-like protein 3 [Gastrolobium bilobum]|uniref:TORTIFOLIA1-like protein 3 n=1 Tax=Gastrolobium bilobum TaxID=150636 RepID=UPI002AAF646B|nr:TORTIFOLIA1-like protein 3 [Gastrolobium bilobum]
MKMPPSTAPTQNIKHKVLTCLTKLSDRDTHSLGATELESIARNLDPNSVPVFLSCIHSTDASDKSPVRKQCVHLLAILSEAHGNVLSPFLSKILANIVRRLRDPDSSVRTACANSVSALSAHVTKQPFSSFLKPLGEALFTEQDPNSQAGAALCLASAIDGAPDPDPARLAKLLPRLEKLLKCEGFKAKAALLALFGSVVEAGGASSHGVLRKLVPCLVESLSSDDWAARKGAAEALVKLAIVERDFLSEFKAGCLKVFENRRFDKVKLVREVMNQMLEAWKQIPDVSDEFSPPPQSHSSSKENASDGRYQPVSQNSCSPGSVMTRLRKKSSPVNRSTPPDRSAANTAKKMSALSGNQRMSSGVLPLPKLNHKNWDVRIPVSNSPFKELQQRDETVVERSKKDKSRFLKSEIKRALFDKNPDDKMHKFGGSKAGSRVAPCSEESQDSVPVCNVTKDVHRNEKESEDLSLIRNQLLQIEKQQSSLLDLLQEFIGSSENGMRCLETRVHGLELALDEISYGLAVSSGRMTKSDAPRNACCLLPGTEFLSSKFWRKTQGRCSSSRFSRSGGTPSLAAIHCRPDRNAETELTSHRFRVHGGGGFITNPLAVINTNSREISGLARAEPV